MNWRRWIVERLDHTAALLTITTVYFDALWGCGLIDERWHERQRDLAALATAFTDFDDP